MRIKTQLCIETYEKQRFTFEAILQKIERVKEITDLDALMICIDGEPEEYAPIVQYCRTHDIQPYLWFPVLADTPRYTPQKSELTVAYDGQRGYGRSGRWGALEQDAEQFLFCCPNNPEALEKVFQVYSTLLDRIDFAGVFLDRIRYPSFTNGFESLFSCFCEHCRAKFALQQGEPLERYQEKIERLLLRLSRITSQDFQHYNRLEALWNDTELKPFFEFRMQNILDIVRRFSEHARQLRKQVGLDLFTPSLAPFVSQDYRRLGEYCDWIKPMSYCHAVGPAGVPLELACLLRALRQLLPGLSDDERFAFLERVVGVSLPAREGELLDQGIPEDFVGKELHNIDDFLLPDSVGIYPGVELVKHPEFTLNIDRANVENYAAQLHQRADGVVASWNLLYIPEEYFSALRETRC